MFANILTNQTDNSKKLILISTFLLSKFKKDSIIIYGGLLRDCIGKKEIHDIDMCIFYNDHTEYDFIEKKFNNKFVNELKNFFEKEGLILNIISNEVESKIPYNIEPDMDLDEKTNNILPLEFNFKKLVFNFTNYQQKITFNLSKDDLEIIKFNMDITFIEENETISNKPLTFEESLTLSNSNPELWEKLLNEKLDSLSLIEEEIQKNVKSIFPNKNINEIINNIKEFKLELVNLEYLDYRNIKRINKFNELGWSIKPITMEQKKIINQKKRFIAKRCDIFEKEQIIIFYTLIESICKIKDSYKDNSYEDNSDVDSSDYEY